MTTSTDILTARRAYVRLSRPIFEEYAMASAMDHAVCPDGYGSDYLERSYERQLYALVVRIASRLGVSVRDVEQEVARFEHQPWGPMYAGS